MKNYSCGIYCSIKDHGITVSKIKFSTFSKTNVLMRLLSAINFPLYSFQDVGNCLCADVLNNTRTKSINYSINRTRCEMYTPKL